jgi:hypothetical protein
VPTSAELVLTPTRAFTEGTGSSHVPYIVATDVVSGGSATAWIDGSDASYGKCDANRTSRGQYPKWHDVDGTIDPTWITAIGVRFRASCANPTVPFVVQLFAQTSKLLSSPVQSGVTVSPPQETSSTAFEWLDYDYVIPDIDYDPVGWAPGGISDAADPTLTLYCRTIPGDQTGVTSSPEIILVSEQSLVIYYTIPDPDPGTSLLASSPVGRLAPLRVHPRNDGYGTSSAPRIYPAPKSYQASNRRAGGYL